MSDHWDTVTPQKRLALSHELVFRWHRCQKCPEIEFQYERSSLFFDSLVEACCATLGKGLELEDKKFSRRTAFNNKDGLWPTSPAEQLLPYGPEASISGLVSLSKITPRAAGLLSALISIYRPLIFPHIITEHNRDRLVEGMISQLHEIADAVKQKIQTVRGPDADSDSITQVPASTVGSILSKQNDYALLLKAIFFGPDAKDHDDEHFTWGREPELYDAILDVVVQLEDPQTWMRGILEVLLRIVERVPLGDRQQQLPTALRERIRGAIQTWNDPFRNLRVVLCNERQQRACSFRRCGKTIYDNASGKSLPLCARCRFVKYCSRECQKADWTHPGMSHREICDILQELNVFGGIDLSEDEFVTACHAHAFPLARVHRLMEWLGLRVSDNPEHIPIALRDAAREPDEPKPTRPVVFCATVEEAEKFFEENFVSIPGPEPGTRMEVANMFCPEPVLQELQRRQRERGQRHDFVKRCEMPPPEVVSEMLGIPLPPDLDPQPSNDAM